MIEYIKAGGRCKQILYLGRHKCVKDKAFGWRCKYCGMPYIVLEKQRRKKLW